MIVNVDFKDVPERVKSVKTHTETRDVSSFLRVGVDRDTIDKAVELFINNPVVVALQFNGADIESDLAFLSAKFPTALAKPILYKIDLQAEDVSALTVARFTEYCSKASAAVRVVFKCPKNYTDMGTVYTISHQYPNAAFCGGYFLNHSDCNIGCIRACDIKGRAVPTRLPVIQGCGSVFETIKFDSTSVFFDCSSSEAPVADKPVRAAKAPKTAKSTSKASGTTAKKTTTLFSLSGDGLGAF